MLKAFEFESSNLKHSNIVFSCSFARQEFFYKWNWWLSISMPQIEWAWSKSWQYKKLNRVWCQMMSICKKKQMSCYISFSQKNSRYSLKNFAEKVLIDFEECFLPEVGGRANQRWILTKIFATHSRHRTSPPTSATDSTPKMYVHQYLV